MKAVMIKEFGGLEKLHFEEFPTPTPKANEALIEIAYTSVNPVDWKICKGLLKNRLPHQFPIVLGWDAAGTIVQIGEDVKGFKRGDEVFAYCRKPVVHNGTYAQFIAVDASHIALKPRNLTFAQAAAVPLVALTAWQSLVDYAHLKSGESILITAGAGGVGGFAIALARYFGATVYTTASKCNHDYVKQLGAAVAIDYTKENVAERIKREEPKGLDVILDCVGGETLNLCYELLKPGGRLVSIAGEIDNDRAAKYNVHANYCFVSPNGKQLEEIGCLIEQEKLKIPQIEEMPLTAVVQALEKNQLGHTRGKIVLKVSDMT